MIKKTAWFAENQAVCIRLTASTQRCSQVRKKILRQDERRLPVNLCRLAQLRTQPAVPHLRI